MEREIGNVDKERELLEEGLKRFPNFLKMLGQLNDCIGHPEAAGQMCEKALLCLSAAALEEKVGGLSKGWAVLTKAILKNAHNPDLWLAVFRLEAQAGNKTKADSLMAKAL